MGVVVFAGGRPGAGFGGEDENAKPVRGRRNSIVRWQGVESVRRTSSAMHPSMPTVLLLLIIFAFGGGQMTGQGVDAARLTPPAPGTARVLRNAQPLEIGLGSPLIGEVKGVKWQEGEAPEGAVTAVLVPDPESRGFFGFYGFYGFYGMNDATGVMLGNDDWAPGSKDGSGSLSDDGTIVGGDGGGINSRPLSGNATCSERLVAVVNSTNVTGILTGPQEYLNCTCVDTLYKEAFGVNATTTGNVTDNSSPTAVPPPSPPPPPPPVTSNSSSNLTNGTVNSITAATPSSPAPVAKLAMCSMLFSNASNTTNVGNVTVSLLASPESLLMHTPWLPGGIDVLNSSLIKMDVDGLIAAENKRRAEIAEATAAKVTNNGTNATHTPQKPTLPSYTVLPHPLPSMAATGLWPLRYPVMTVPAAGGKPVCLLDLPTAAELMPAPGSGGYLTREAFGEYVYKVLLPDLLFNRSDGVVMRTSWDQSNVTNLFGNCIGDPPGPPKPPKKDPLQWLYDDPILGALLGTSLPAIIAGVMKKIKDSKERLVRAKKFAIDKFKELKKKQMKWRNKVDYMAVQVRRQTREMEEEIRAQMNYWYSYKPPPEELKPFKGNREAFRKAKQQELKNERDVAKENLAKQFDDYEGMYEQREKERLQEIMEILTDAMPKKLAQMFVDNLNMMPLEAIEAMERAATGLTKKDNKVAPEPSKKGEPEGEDPAGEGGTGVDVASTNPKVVNFKRKKGAKLPPLPGLPAPIAAEQEGDAKLDKK